MIEGMSNRNPDNVSPLAIGLISSAVGLVGLVVVVFVREWMTTVWTLVLVTFFSLLMVGSAFAATYAPGGRPNTYSDPESLAEPAKSVPEFLPEDARSSRIRRVLVTCVRWLALGVWVPCYAVPIALLLPGMLTDPDRDVDPTGILTSLAVGSVALAVFVLLVIFGPKLTVESPHVRSLRGALPGAFVVPNKTTVGLNRMIKSTAPGARAPAGGASYSYIAVTAKALSVWSPTRGRLMRLVEIPLQSITRVSQASVDLRFSAVPGVVVTTTALVEPLELCPAENLADYRSSSERLIGLLRAEPR